MKSKIIVVRYMEKYSIFSSTNNVTLICDDIERCCDIYDPPESIKWYVFIAGEKFIKSDSWSWDI